MHLWIGGMEGEMNNAGINRTRNKKKFYGIPPTYARFHICINSLMTKYKVLQWYIEMNSGGTVHSEHELNRVRDLLCTC